MTPMPLSESLSRALFQRMGSDQHLELAGYVRDAEKTILNADAALAVRHLWTTSPWTVESNLDMVSWPSCPTWYEMPGCLRTMDVNDGVMGFLIMPHPEEEGIYVVATAFETPDIIARHCYAVAIIDAAALALHAVQARKFYSRTEDESVERIMSLIGVMISEDFRDELMISEDGREEVIEAVMRDATVDIPFLLSLLTAEAADNGFIIDLTEDGAVTSSEPLPVRSKIARFGDRMARRLSSGLVRLPRSRSTPKLVWYA